MSAHYSGDSNFKPSSGESSSEPHSVVLAEDASLTEATAVADGRSNEGIPIVLTNTNPFPVSADEELTVSGYPSVANSSAADAARTQAIAHAKFTLAPLQTITAKVKLSRGATKLLRKREHLRATLISTTKRSGQHSRVSRNHLSIRS